MLIDSPPRSLEKRLCILAPNAALRQVLGGILSEWGYRLLETPSTADLLLVEEGIPLPEKEVPVLWLSRSGYQERNRLNLPLTVERLWSALESRFHRPPRNHIRLHRILPVEVTVRGVLSGSTIVSLSDLGTRFDHPEELVNGEEVSLELVLESRPVALPGHVIYVVPDRAGRAAYQVGMIFDRTPAEVRTGLREHIVWCYLETVRRKIEPWAFTEGLSLLDLPPAVAERLGS